MAPKVQQLPFDDRIQRGDTWEHTWEFFEADPEDPDTEIPVDVSGDDWTLVFAHSRYDDTQTEATCVVGGDDDNEVTATIEPEDTDAIVSNLVEGELQAAPDDTRITVIVPVTGQINRSGEST